MTDQAMATQVDENDFGAAFDEDDAVVTETPEEDTDQDEGGGVEEGTTVDGETAGMEPEAPPVDEWRTKAEAFEQQAKDHQKAFTDQAMENADLKRRLTALEAKKAEVPTGADEGSGDGDEGDELFLDYAGAPKAIRREAEKLIKERFGDLDPASIKAAVETQQAQRWESAVMFGTVDPETKDYVPGVSDLYAITHEGNKEYWDWYRAKGYDQSGHPPHKAIKILNEFKEHRAAKAMADETATTDAAARDKAAGIREQAGGALPASVRKVPAPKKKDEGSFQDGYDEVD